MPKYWVLGSGMQYHENEELIEAADEAEAVRIFKEDFFWLEPMGSEIEVDDIMRVDDEDA